MWPSRGRANELYLSYPLIRAGYGGSGDMMQQPSRFLEEIPAELVEEWNLRPYDPYGDGNNAKAQRSRDAKLVGTGNLKLQPRRGSPKAGEGKARDEIQKLCGFASLR